MSWNGAWKGAKTISSDFARKIVTERHARRRIATIETSIVGRSMADIFADCLTAAGRTEIEITYARGIRMSSNGEPGANDLHVYRVSWEGPRFDGTPAGLACLWWPEYKRLG